MASLRFSLARTLAEEATFGHTPTGSYRADVNGWRECAGLHEPQDETMLEGALGVPFKEVVQATRVELGTCASTVTAVARALGESKGAVLSYEEVCRIVGTVGPAES